MTSSSSAQPSEEMKLLNGFTYTFAQGEKVGIVGKNGAGKTTFLRLVIGEMEASSGDRSVSENVCFGYYDQRGLMTGKDVRVLDYVTEMVDLGQARSPQRFSLDEYGDKAAGGVVIPSQNEARRMLKRFSIPAASWNDRVMSLSGGERRRLQLLATLAKRPNFLLLDEPSNDLDILTLGALEEFLIEEFKGVLMVVSHDRFFMDRVVAGDRGSFLVFQGGGEVAHFKGTYTDYLTLEEQRAGQQAAESSPLPSEKYETLTGFQPTGKHFMFAAKPQAEGREEEAYVADPGREGGSLSMPQEALGGANAYTPEEKKARSPVFAEALPDFLVASEVADSNTEKRLSPKKAAAMAADMAKQAAEQKAAKKKAKPLNKKAAKKLADELEGIEALVEETEAEATKLEEEMTSCVDLKPRPTMKYRTELADRASKARRTADLTMERWLELEELVEAQK
eukprot:CAMPEP_0185769364 /NCGR_PEP_ID=MMETSP1174-20130828/53545_1 /TAXON_ID=35687 /ORGANISM="Dictyocha speculum, Strain CCMP1381" /LENGTH=451 /DNA_ID=CAMNT_0028454393 /DNA_START=51 /DNA_END=1406 /DNA_ORIENTATION=-